ncbi:MAG: GAF domain-containing protein [Desulfobacterales bacterium]|nr:GAF domain-containing protein [Desulfobacterales bacterium]MCF8078773.1 GAF domain-containing protein [Desulfobacterales bacterium]
MPSASKITEFYETFREISGLVHSSTDVKEVLDLVVWKVTEALNAKAALLRILNLRTGEFEPSASYGLSDTYLSKGPVTQKHLITDVYKQRPYIIIKDVQSDERIFYRKELEAEGISMILDLPLVFRDNMAGLLRIFFREKKVFEPDEIDFAVSLAQQSSCAIDKARLIEEQQARYDQLALHTEKLSALGRMAAGIAHEINNPLAGVLLYSSSLAKKVKDDGPLKEGLDIIIRETQRCKIIIQDLLEFARDREPQKNTADIHRVIDQAVTMLENEFRLRQIQLDRTYAPNMKKALLDANQLQQVLINLLLNAAHAIEQKGTVSIRTRMDAAGKKMVIEVQDTGCGVQPEHLNKLFEPFFSTKKNGSGLGLAVSYGIVQNHQGQLTVESQPGKGACFTITLPLVDDKRKSYQRWQ